MQKDMLSHEQLAKIAKEDPERLEQIRQDLINELIESVPEHRQKRLRGLQFQIDCQRKLHSSPMGACIAISRMMHESLHRLNDLLNAQDEQAPEPSIEPAKVLRFTTAG